MSLEAVVGPVDRLIGDKPMHAKTYHRFSKTINEIDGAGGIFKLHDLVYQQVDSLLTMYTFWRLGFFRITVYNVQKMLGMDGALRVGYTPDPRIKVYSAGHSTVRNQPIMQRYNKDLSYEFRTPGWRYSKIGDEVRLHDFGTLQVLVYKSDYFALSNPFVLEFEFEVHYSIPTIQSSLFSLDAAFNKGAEPKLPITTLEYLSAETTKISNGAMRLSMIIPLDIDYTYSLPDGQNAKGICNFNESNVLTLNFKPTVESEELYSYNLLFAKADLTDIANVLDDVYFDGNYTGLYVNVDFWPWQVIPSDFAILESVAWNGVTNVGIDPNLVFPPCLYFSGNVTYQTESPSRAIDYEFGETGSAYEDLLLTELHETHI